MSERDYEEAWKRWFQRAAEGITMGTCLQWYHDLDESAESEKVGKRSTFICIVSPRYPAHARRTPFSRSTSNQESQC